MNKRKFNRLFVIDRVIQLLNVSPRLSSVEALEWKLGKLTKRRRELSKAEDVQSSVSEADQVPPTAEAIPIPSIDPNTDSVSSKDS